MKKRDGTITFGSETMIATCNFKYDDSVLSPTGRSLLIKEVIQDWLKTWQDYYKKPPYVLSIQMGIDVYEYFKMLPSAYDDKVIIYGVEIPVRPNWEVARNTIIIKFAILPNKL